MIKKLLLLFWKLGKKQIRTAPDSTKIAIVFASIGALIVTVFFSIAAFAIAMTLPQESIGPMFAFGFSVLLAFNILFGVPQVFKNLYGTNDLAFLFTLPIKTSSIYWVKFLQSFIGVPGILLFISTIILTVFGIGSKSSILFFPIAYIVALFITLIGMSISYLLNLVLIQLIPVHRAKELMAAMSAIAGMFGYVLFQLPNILNNNDAQSDVFYDLPQVPNWLPMEWGGRSLIEAIAGSFEFILPLTLLALLSALMLYLSSVLVEKGFRTGWIRMNEGNRPKKKRKGKKIKVKLSNPIIAIGIKEWKAIHRDMREWINFLPVLFFMIFPFLTIFNDKESISFILKHPNISWILVQGIFLFMFTFLTSGFSSSSIAREAYSIHLLRVLPLSGWQIALGKFWINWLIPVLFLCILEMFGGILLKWNSLQILSGIAVISIMSLGITGIGLWIGSIGAKYNPNNPQNRLETGVSFLLMFLSCAYLFVAALPSAIVLIPTDVLFILQEGENPPGVLGLFFTILEWKAENNTLLTISGTIFTLIISVGVACLTLYLSVRRINKGVTINFITHKK
ncbi:putative ABC transporter permease subunit [Cytobacillus massiliigabonensis]|uniref:putative ABC transporter permease subunit n=1 Tax=Cytobacillus massiliigabonensis TaxID=1871011 RepID=UPI000C85DA7D|nr:hypothetical protein [Cytobacillus massiliigabonensis]